jgi:hypothetical protein
MASFKVTSVTERPTIDAAGNVVKSTTITLKTTLGATGSIEVPSDQLEVLTMSDEGKAALQDMLNQKADQLDAPFGM